MFKHKLKISTSQAQLLKKVIMMNKGVIEEDRLKLKLYIDKNILIIKIFSIQIKWIVFVLTVILLIFFTIIQFLGNGFTNPVVIQIFLLFYIGAISTFIIHYFTEKTRVIKAVTKFINEKKYISK
ncbi:MAG: hypothetical protein KAR38_13690 [Calditrichia bacterium]|nr:hypothetical protein [Calditrichia bacterium]